MLRSSRSMTLLPIPNFERALTGFLLYARMQSCRNKRTINSAGECYLHTVEVTGSNPVSSISKTPIVVGSGFHPDVENLLVVAELYRCCHEPCRRFPVFCTFIYAGTWHHFPFPPLAVRYWFPLQRPRRYSSCSDLIGASTPQTGFCRNTGKALRSSRRATIPPLPSCSDLIGASTPQTCFR